MKLQPLVSIGMPIFNGENFMRQAIESVLSQDYQHFELLISDNGSQDATAEICKEFMAKDERIKYHRFDVNQGASKNYNKTFEMASGKYFKWLAHDDMITPQNLTKSVAILDAKPEVVLCGSAKTNLNANREVIDETSYDSLNLQTGSTKERFSAILKHFAHTFTDADLVLTGLMRTDILRQTILIANYTSADFTLLADLVLKGKFVVLDEPLYQRRIHHGISTSVHNSDPKKARNISAKEKIVHKSHAEIAKWYDPKGKVRKIPHLTWFAELRRSIRKNNFDISDRFRLLAMSYRWFVGRVWKSIKDKLFK